MVCRAELQLSEGKGLLLPPYRSLIGRKETLCRLLLIDRLAKALELDRVQLHTDHKKQAYGST